MDELELVRLHEDGEHLVLGGAGGAHYLLPITESLRAAVRRDRPHLEHLRAEGERNLSPREIQSRLRAGDDVEDVAEAAGIPVESVRRFAGPVVAEQEYVVDRVRRSPQGHGDDAPTIDDLAARRLAARDVDPATVVWSAARQHGAAWVVTATFEVSSGPRAARWTYDPTSRALHALDDEARWLSQPESEPDPSPGTAAVFDVDAGTARRRPEAETSAQDGTADLLDDLGRRRGVRPRTEPAGAATDVPGQEPFEGFGPRAALRDGEGTEPAVRDVDRPGAERGGPDETRGRGATVVHLPSIRAREAADDQHPLDEPAATRDHPADRGPHGAARSDEAHADPTDPSGHGSRDDASEPEAGAARRPGAREPRKSKNRSRAKVPSWDEIVFGARPEG
ncbi:septation protein SepH [Cellulosimicrobium sp. PMB13]|uniref:septation protein SepH n=1 Tax=Cellulosimicrobium sp. PMB13 TaxID=3120158 RepID=UPI003F4B0EC3